MFYLYRVNEALIKCEGNDVESEVPYAGLSVEERLQHLFQIKLHNGAAHPRGDVSHLLQILLFGQFFPCKDTK